MMRVVNGAPEIEGMNKRPAYIRVWPLNEDIRKYIFHPGGAGGARIYFKNSIEESVEWPFDAFTKRRIKSGKVLTSPPSVQIAPTSPEVSEPAPEPVVSLEAASDSTDEVKANESRRRSSRAN
jgi:hypothetical protein